MANTWNCSPSSPSHPAGDLRRRPVPGHTEWILIDGQSGFTLREMLDGTELNPGLRGAAADGPQEIAEHWDAHQHSSHCVQRQSEHKQEAATRGWGWRTGSPLASLEPSADLLLQALVLFSLSRERAGVREAKPLDQALPPSLPSPRGRGDWGSPRPPQEDDNEASRLGPPHFNTGTRPSHHRLPLRSKPGHHVGNLLRGQRLTWDVFAPVRHPEVRSASNNRRAQGLIADQRKVGGIHDRPTLVAPVAVGTVAARTGFGKHLQALVGIPGARAIVNRLRCIVWRQRDFGACNGRLQRFSMSLTSASICGSVSAPPARPRTPACWCPGRPAQ